MTQILMIEDEESLSDPLAYLLGREGFEVTVVADGLEAVAQFDRTGADLVLLDLMLPGQSGTEVCKQIRQRSTVPIIMLTAKDAEIDKVLGLELGADDYVTKPYSSRELVARIRAVLRRGGPVAEHRLAPQQRGEIGVDQRPDERVDLPAVVVDAGGDIDHLRAPAPRPPPASGPARHQASRSGRWPGRRLAEPGCGTPASPHRSPTSRRRNPAPGRRRSAR